MGTGLTDVERETVDLVSEDQREDYLGRNRGGEIAILFEDLQG